MEATGYTDLEPIGRGGFSTVYRARQVAVDRHVAVKVLTVDLVDEAARARFRRECATNGRVGAHPNIVTVYDSGFTSDGHPFLSMQLCDGGSLGDALRRRGPLPVPEVLHAGVSIAAALAFAHAAGVLHRDIKPENIMLSQFGEPLLADFGIAVVDDQRVSTATAASFTVNHAAPESLTGTAPSASADIYSLASTLYTLLAGHPPFVAETSAALLVLLSMVMNDPPAPPERTDIPASLTRLLLSGLAKTPAGRPVDATAFGRALQQVQAELGLPVTAWLTTSIAPPPTTGGGAGARTGGDTTQAASGAPSGGPRLGREPIIVEPLAPSVTGIAAAPPVAEMTMMGIRGNPRLDPPAPPPNDPAHPPRRRRGAAVLIGAVTVVALLAGGGTYYLLARPSSSAEVAQAAGQVGTTPDSATDPAADVPDPSDATSSTAPPTESTAWAPGTEFVDVVTSGNVTSEEPPTSPSEPGNVTKTATVVVSVGPPAEPTTPPKKTKAPAVPPSIVSFSETPPGSDSVSCGALSTVTLQMVWASTNATTAWIGVNSGPDASLDPFYFELPANVGPPPATLPFAVVPFDCTKAQNSFTLTVSGPAGKASKTLTYYNKLPPPPPPLTQAPTTTYILTYVRPSLITKWSLPPLITGP